MNPRIRARAWAAFGLAGVLATSACEEATPPAFTYYDERVAPVLGVGCVQQTTGCHVASTEQTAVGNLDLSSYDALMRRADLLPAMGPYPVGALLLKGGDSLEVPVQTFDAPILPGPTSVSWPSPPTFVMRAASHCTWAPTAMRSSRAGSRRATVETARSTKR